MFPLADEELAAVAAALRKLNEAR